MDSKGFALRCDNLEFSYTQGVKVLDRTSLTLPGESVGVVFGKSGSGKSTLLRCLMGYLRPTAGTITWPPDTAINRLSKFEELYETTGSAHELVGLWKRIDEQRETARMGMRRRLLYTGQSASMMMFADCSNALPHLTAEENIGMVLAPVCADMRIRDQATSLLLEITALSNVRHQPPPQLSSGQLRRLCLAQSLATIPRLLVWDEPTSGLDTGTKYELLRFIQSLRSTVPLPGLIVTHDIETALLLADEIYLFGGGKIMRTLKVPIPRPRYPHDLDRPEYRPLRHEMVGFLEYEVSFENGGKQELPSAQPALMT
jgi:molybdate transport system ATP-binding protein